MDSHSLETFEEAAQNAQKLLQGFEKSNETTKMLNQLD
jgi:hypothetical protein